MKYFGQWSSYEEMAREFGDYGGYSERRAPKDMPPASEILFASYCAEGYEGDAFVIFEHEGQLFEVHGSHCSCYGLEGQWVPEATSWKALAMRLPTTNGGYTPLNYHEESARKKFIRLVEDHTRE